MLASVPASEVANVPLYLTPLFWTAMAAIGSIVAAGATAYAAWGSKRSADTALRAVKASTQPRLIVLRNPAVSLPASRSGPVSAARYAFTVENRGQGIAILGENPFGSSMEPQHSGRLVVLERPIPTILRPDEDMNVEIGLGYWQEQVMEDPFSFSMTYFDMEHVSYKTIVNISPTTGEIVDMTYHLGVGRLEEIPEKRPLLTHHLLGLVNAKRALCLTVPDPWSVLYPHLLTTGMPISDSRFDKAADADQLLGMLRQHTTEHRMWKLIRELEMSIEEYRQYAGSLVVEVIDCAESATGLSLSKEGHMVGDPSVVQERYVLGPLEYVLEEYGGQPMDWESTVVPHHGVPDLYELWGGPGSSHQTMAAGSKEHMEHAKEAQATLFSFLREGLRIPELLRQHAHSVRLSEEAEAARVKMTLAVIDRGSCSQCQRRLNATILPTSDGRTGILTASVEPDQEGQQV